MTAIDLVDYWPNAGLDAELADLCYASLRGASDQRPVTPALVRAWLRQSGLTATTLAVHRGQDGRLLGAAAICWPGAPESSGRMWGPFVHPDVRGAGVGTALFAALDVVISNRPGVRMATVAIPETRNTGWTLYERAGWQALGKATLLRRQLPSTVDELPPPPAADATGVVVRTVRAGEYLDPAIASLVTGVRPAMTFARARDTLTRWTTDERYRPDGLLLAEPADAGPADPSALGTGGPGDRLLGAALVYRLQQPASDEPVEARLADLLVAAHLEAATAAAVRACLVDAVVRVGVALGATVARAVVESEDLSAALLQAGFEVGDRVRYYSRPDPVGSPDPAQSPGPGRISERRV
jgi:GNAT superfamily N-acetyltransferase